MSATAQQRHILHVHFHLPPGDGLGMFERLLDLAEGITPRVQALPPDNADLDVTGALAYFGRDAHGLAQILRLRALALYGVQTTAGSAGNRMLAAMACASSPPGQITHVGHDPAAIAAFLRPRPVTALYGVGPATAGTLSRHGLHTIGAVADTPLLTLQRLLGAAAGRDVRARAHGHDPRPVTPHSPARLRQWAEHGTPLNDLLRLPAAARRRPAVARRGLTRRRPARCGPDGAQPVSGR